MSSRASRCRTRVRCGSSRTSSSTPHLAGRSDRYVEQALAIVEPNVRAFLAGRREDIVNVVDRRNG